MDYLQFREEFKKIEYLNDNIDKEIFRTKITSKYLIDSGGIVEAINLGSGHEIYKQKTGTVLEFKSLVAGSNIVINDDINSLTIESTSNSLWEEEDTINIRPKSSKKIKYEIISNPPLIKNEYVTIGTGGEYATINAAYVAGFRRFKILSNITETVGFVGYTSIEIFADTEKQVNVSAAGGHNIILIARNIRFNVTGTAYIFYTGCTLYLYNCSIYGNNESNIFCYDSCNVYADRLILSPGTVYFKLFFIKLVSEIVLIGTGAVNNFTYITGFVGLLTTSGNFGSDVWNNRFIYTRLGGTIEIVNAGHTLDSVLYCEGYSHINKSMGNRINIAPADTNVSLRNCLINILRTNTGWSGLTVENCNINSISYNRINSSVKSFVNNTIASGTIDVQVESILKNNTFYALSISGDKVTLRDNKCTGGTITITSTADKTLISGNRTLTAISNLGTNTIDDMTNSLI